MNIELEGGWYANYLLQIYINIPTKTNSVEQLIKIYV